MIRYFIEDSYSKQNYTIWCEPRDHVVMQPTIKIEIWSRKAEKGPIGVWHNVNLLQDTQHYWNEVELRHGVS